MMNKWIDLTRGKQVEILEYYHALEDVDKKNVFQECARLRQSLWREKLGFKPVLYKGKLRGSRLDMPDIHDTLSNFLTETIGDLVRKELTSNSKGLIDKERLLTNLLSSQPLCFNLFGELTDDLELATNVLSDLTKGRISEVQEIKFEYSPGREDPKYTDDKTAFDVYVVYSTSTGQRGFAGIEVKYHENPNDENGEQGYYDNHKDRYECIADQMNCFRPEKLTYIRGKPIQQFWRDHLLVGAHKIENQFDDAFFAVLYPKDNEACEKAVRSYRECLSSGESFQVWKLECFVEQLRHYSSADWIENFKSRYLDFEVLNRLVKDDSQEE